MVEALSQAGSDYREHLYDQGPSGAHTAVRRDDLTGFLSRARALMEASIRSNRRPDGLYHSYNLMSWQGDQLEVETMYEMLEGQVAVLSSGVLSAAEVIQLLDALRSSTLYRKDQDSYILYPNRELPAFLEKNRLEESHIQQHPLLRQLVDDGDTRIVRRDQSGGYHFSGSFRNSADVKAAIASMDEKYADLSSDNGAAVARLFEAIFQHRQFTGRSGTFFAYEGLGSIYWHMVSKLGLAVSENVTAAVDSGEPAEVIQALKDHLAAIRDGIGAEKSPDAYGAFPTDPYSHTPENAGVKQPGMTGQVKEDVLARYTEVGVHILDGQLGFRLDGFDVTECVSGDTSFEYYDVSGAAQSIIVPSGGFGYTICQVPVVYCPSDNDELLIRSVDGSTVIVDGHTLDTQTSRKLFGRTSEVTSIECRCSRLAN